MPEVNPALNGEQLLTWNLREAANIPKVEETEWEMVSVGDVSVLQEKLNEMWETWEMYLKHVFLLRGSFSFYLWKQLWGKTELIVSGFIFFQASR